MSFLARFQRKKEDPELARRDRLLRAGRIGEAVVVQTKKDNADHIIVFYNYSIAGVEYQSSQIAASAYDTHSNLAAISNQDFAKQSGCQWLAASNQFLVINRS